MRRRANAAAQTLLRDGERRADGHGRHDVSVLPVVRRAECGVQSLLRGEQHRHAADRRHDELARARDRRGTPGHSPAGGSGDNFVGLEPADRRRAAGRVRDARTQWHHGLGRRLAAEETLVANVSGESLLEVSAITKRFGGFTALDRVDLVVRPGERLGLIGPNGSGKSTLVNCIAGTLRNEEGGIRFEGRDVGKDPPHRRTRLGLARTFQIPRPFASMSVLDNLRIQKHEKLPTSHVTDEALHILQQVGLGDKAQAMSGRLTQVDMRKLELARAMAAKPKLLISDEAMAGLSTSEVDEILALLSGLKQQGVAVIMIEHVMRAVMNFSERIAVLVAGRKIADGDPKAVASNME
ncbi:MAG: ABC transporter ATP-binding protein, partial [Betaproteobacteria bacterium]